MPNFELPEHWQQYIQAGEVLTLEEIWERARIGGAMTPSDQAQQDTPSYTMAEVLNAQSQRLTLGIQPPLSADYKHYVIGDEWRLIDVSMVIAVDIHPVDTSEETIPPDRGVIYFLGGAKMYVSPGFAQSVLNALAYLPFIRAAHYSRPLPNQYTEVFPTGENGDSLDPNVRQGNSQSSETLPS
jgi:hypothetical protein